MDLNFQNNGRFESFEYIYHKKDKNLERNLYVQNILAVLNSSVAREWFYSYGKKRGAGVDIGVDKIRSFPIMPCDISTQKDIAEKVIKLLDNYTQNIDLDKEIDDTINSIYGR